ncbi:VOC family protein [Shewanella nanhaiensis]|uniref:VOC family protein n=1 Tax=Shewanella nanhaiensis TaxID=2864872 RepID=A0ABS7E6L6_9GAMM|nr:VOC family protein [Shewanella nanhaiensis]MBW8185316.1 VOC family protein [Shewanella nanhaiensis]
MKVNQYVHGQPCWVELASRDAHAGKQFYSTLFGWKVQDMPIPNGVYSMLALEVEGECSDIGAAYQMPEAMSEQGAPTTWTVYFAVDNVDATVAAVISNGGNLELGPHDVGTAGRMALLSDPEGARFAIWQAGDHIGAKRNGEDGSLCWVELASRDSQDAKAFYTSSLGWDSRQDSMPDFTYTEWLVEDVPFGGMMEMTEEWGEMPAHWMLYFAVEDCDKTVEVATGLGAKICVPPTNIPEVGRFSVISDPQGGFFSVITLNSKS